ncbi:hypothetical protein V8G54_023910 [Vigna mungo]|uniref:Serine-threonine/tyrosine-protein kinase catalytic domain-containing protein n=1 Tax=Vigna mungo TaxID=3915 RepID=A0AAQ3N4Z8_VIGMU
MAPEYAMEGLFSVKSDVFSFGVLVLEIISGRKNGGFYLSDGENLLALRTWYEGKCLELMDSMLEKSFIGSEVERCIQIGLLCVQEDARDRPTMSDVVPFQNPGTQQFQLEERPQRKSLHQEVPRNFPLVI